MNFGGFKAKCTVVGVAYSDPKGTYHDRPGATAERYGQKESRVLCSISYPTVAFLHLSFVLRIVKHSALPVSLEYTLHALPIFADQGPFD